jgi:hypothetical protein
MKDEACQLPIVRYVAKHTSEFLVVRIKCTKGIHFWFHEILVCRIPAQVFIYLLWILREQCALGVGRKERINHEYCLAFVDLI